MWGQQLFGVEDVWKVFCNYLTQKENKNGVKVSSQLRRDPVDKRR